MSIVHHITNRPIRVSDCLMEHFRLTRDSAKDLLDLGAIYSNKRRIFEDRDLDKGTYLRIHLRPKRFPVSAIDWKTRIFADEKDFVVINKPVGVPTHASVDNARENCLEQLRNVTGYSLFVTQRLDIPVSGLLLFAKTPAFQTLFNRYLAERKVTKIYRAVSHGKIEPGRYLNYMEPSERSPKRMSKEIVSGWQTCELSILSCEPQGNHFAMDVELHTGRTHQIRAQLSLLGAPIVGDRMYGGERNSEGEGIGLECRQLKFSYHGRALAFSL